MTKLTHKEIKKIYKIIKAVDEGLLINPQEDWEQDHYDGRLIDKKGLKQILIKLKSLSPDAIGNAEKKILARKYDSYNNIIDENVERKIAKGFNNRFTIFMEYFSIEREEFVEREIDVYAKNSKYIVGRSHSTNNIRKYRLSRIRKAKITSEKYEIPNDFKKKNYL